MTHLHASNEAELTSSTELSRPATKPTTEAAELFLAVLPQI
jgi:hypothetical protein